MQGHQQQDALSPSTTPSSTPDTSHERPAQPPYVPPSLPSTSSSPLQHVPSVTFAETVTEHRVPSTTHVAHTGPLHSSGSLIRTSSLSPTILQRARQAHSHTDAVEGHTQVHLSGGSTQQGEHSPHGPMGTLSRTVSQWPVTRTVSTALEKHPTLQSTLSTMGHYMHLLVAEHPVQEHRTYVRKRGQTHTQGEGLTPRWDSTSPSARQTDRRTGTTTITSDLESAVGIHRLTSGLHGSITGPQGGPSGTPSTVWTGSTPRSRFMSGALTSVTESVDMSYAEANRLPKPAKRRSSTLEYHVHAIGGPQGVPSVGHMGPPGVQPSGLYTAQSLSPEEKLYRSELVRRRWQYAALTVIDHLHVAHDAAVLSDMYAPAAERLFSLIRLHAMLHDQPHKHKIMQKIRARRGSLQVVSQALTQELLVTGERVFAWFTPAPLEEHKLYFTPIFAACCLITFAWMAGEYPSYVLLTFQNTAAGAPQCLMELQQAGVVQYGPKQMMRWINAQGARWCFGEDAWSFNARFLIIWGARWAPVMTADAARWFTPMFLHRNFSHLLSNMLLFLLLSYQLERKYGAVRIVILWLFAAVGGALFSACFEPPCTAVAGASGGIFGLIGLFIADLLLNFETIKRPILRCLFLIAFLIYFIVTVATGNAGVSHLSHVGGFICGLLPALLFLPNLKARHWEKLLPPFGIISTVVLFITLFVYFYVAVLPNVCCGSGCPS